MKYLPSAFWVHVYTDIILVEPLAIVEPGHFHLTRYNVPGVLAIYHERLPVLRTSAAGGASTHWVVTPDGDDYDEDTGVTHDVAAVVPIFGQGAASLGIPDGDPQHNSFL